MLIKTNNFELATACQKIAGVDVVEIDREKINPPYLIFSGDELLKMVELMNSAKGKMLLNLIGAK